MVFTSCFLQRKTLSLEKKKKNAFLVQFYHFGVKRSRDFFYNFRFYKNLFFKKCVKRLQRFFKFFS